MDELIFQEFKGTGNSEIILDRKVAELRLWPAINLAASGTRKEEDLLEPSLLEKTSFLRRAMSPMKIIDAAGITGVTGEKILQLPAEVGTFQSPRCKFALELYQKYFRMYGTQYDNKIMYEYIVSFFLLDNPNGIV